MLSVERARSLKPLLDAFASRDGWADRKRFDPIEFPGRYSSPRDVEVAGLLGAALAYGRADLFKPKVDGLLKQMGASPAAYVSELTVARAAKLLDGFVYRFNLGADVAVLLLGMGAALKAHGSLEQLFVEGGGSAHESLALPIYGELTPAQQQTVVDAIAEYALARLDDRLRGVVREFRQRFAARE